MARPAPDVTRGYIPLEGEAVAASRGEVTPGDLNESLMIGPVDVPDGDPYSPRPGARQALPPEPLARAARATCARRGPRTSAPWAIWPPTIMRMFASALDEPEDFFDDKVDRHISRLRVRNYPEQPERPPRPDSCARAPTRTTGASPS